MVDLGPARKRIAQLFRMLGSSGGERHNAFAALERIMQSQGVTWNDFGDVIEHCGDNDKYTETDMHEFAQAARVAGVEAGIKIGLARASNGSGNGQLVLPKPVEMAKYCHERLGQLKDDKQRNFVSDMHVITRGGNNMSLSRLGYLASIYIKIGGKI